MTVMITATRKASRDYFRRPFLYNSQFEGKYIATDLFLVIHCCTKAVVMPIDFLILYNNISKTKRKKKLLLWATPTQLTSKLDTVCYTDNG